MQFTFTETQSSAIASATIDGQNVSISFHSNPERVYSYVTEQEDMISNFFQNPGDDSIGQTYRQWVDQNILIPTESLSA
jgi:hypothetical protein